MEVNFYEMYLEEMALIPVLEAEEEKKVLALAAEGDKEAKKRLVEGYLAKAAQMVKEYEGRELPMSEYGSQGKCTPDSIPGNGKRAGERSNGDRTG